MEMQQRYQNSISQQKMQFNVWKTSYLAVSFFLHLEWIQMYLTILMYFAYAIMSTSDCWSLAA